MKASTRFFCWILVGVMFCAVSIGGCGGGGSSIPSASNTTSGDIDQPVSGDTSGGRGGSGWDEFEDVAFEYLNGTWEIEYISMTANPSGVATGTEIDLFCNLDGMPQLVFTTSSNNELTIKTLDGRTSPVFTSDFYGYSQTYGQVSSKGIAIIAGGQYTMIADNTYRQTVSNQNYYMLKGKKGTGTKSSQWKYVEFTNVYNVETDPLNSFKVTTVLTPAQYTPLGDYEIPNPIELLNNTVWRIAHSEVSPGPACKWTGVTDMGVFDIGKPPHD